MKQHSFQESDTRPRVLASSASPRPHIFISSYILIERGKEAAALAAKNEYHTAQIFSGSAELFSKTFGTKEFLAKTIDVLVIQSRLVAGHTFSALEAIIIKHGEEISR